MASRSPEAIAKERAATKAWKLRNPERVKEIERKSREKRKGMRKECPEKRAERYALWAAKNLVWYRNRRLARKKDRLANDPAYRLAETVRSRIKCALRDGAKTGSAVALLGCTAQEAVDHIASKFKPGMSWRNHGEWHIDHIRPLSSFDLNDPQQLAEACHFTNLQPLWAKENLQKGSQR